MNKRSHPYLDVLYYQTKNGQNILSNLHDIKYFSALIILSNLSTVKGL